MPNSPELPYIGLASGICVVSPPATQDQDARNAGIGSKLKVYYDIRPSVSGAQASATLSATLLSSGSTLPTVTISGPLSPPREVSIDYPVGGARGTATYRIQLDGGDSILTGTTGSSPVDIGGGNEITFGNDANYTINTTFSTATIHRTQVVSLAELTGRANCTLTNALTTFGMRYEAWGINNKYPSLYTSTCAFNNDVGVPALVTGNDVQFWVWMLYEMWSLPQSNANQVPWAFVNQTDTTKSFIDALFNGTGVANPSLMAVQRKNSASTPVTSALISTLKTDQAPKVVCWKITSSGQIKMNGRPMRSAATTLDTGGTTTLNRFLVGGLKLGTSAFLSTAWDRARWSALAITDPLSAAEEVAMLKAFA